MGEIEMVEEISVPIAQEWLEEFCKAVIELEDYLNELDTAVGDGEHGSNISNGARALLEAFKTPQYKSLGEFFEFVGMTVINSVGGASGALYGTLFLRLSDVTADRSTANLETVSQAFESALDGIMELGRVKPGDKTLLDALHPAAISLIASAESSEDLLEAFTKAHYAAELGCAATAQMEARKGRGSYQGERSVGHIDPGATSMAALFGTLSNTIHIHSKQEQKKSIIKQ
jgi:dihydroxyacetone kinase-like protein